MEYLDIHSHILCGIDDGAGDIDTSLELLKMLKEQGVTAVIATPHFYPDSDSAEAFAENAKSAYKQLKSVAAGKELPEIYLGCELRYFSGIGKSRDLEQFVIKGTDYLLLELPYGAAITKTVLNDIMTLSDSFNVILAHIERYHRVVGYKKLLKLIADGYAIAHINADGITSKEESKVCERLIKRGLVSFVASDTHSLRLRPPKIKEALERITERLGRSAANRLIFNSNRLLEELQGFDYKL